MNKIQNYNFHIERLEDALFLLEAVYKQLEHDLLEDAIDSLKIVKDSIKKDIEKEIENAKSTKE